MADVNRLKDTLSQYEDGAITYVEFVRWALAQVTEEDVREHNQRGHFDEFSAEWPFLG